MARVTIGQLDRLVARLHMATGKPSGHYYLYYGYGGVSLMVHVEGSKPGAVQKIYGVGTRKELYDQMFRFIWKLENGRLNVAS